MKSAICSILLQRSIINPKQAGLFADLYGRKGGGQIHSAPFCKFCLNGPIDLKFGM